MARPPFLEALRQGVLLADGAMGTLLYSQGGDCSCFEALNLREPQRVLAAHQAYRQAGACLLETNPNRKKTMLISHSSCACSLR